MSFLYLVFFIATLLSSPLTGSCPPNPSWYTSTIQVDRPTLPTGVDVSYTPDVVTLTNTTDVPLYLFRRYTRGYLSHSSPIVTTLGLEETYEVIEKIESNQIFIWQEDTGEWRDLTVSTSTDHPIDNIQIHLHESDGNEKVFAPTYQYINPPTLEPRPDDLSAPAPQSTYILLAYDNELIKIPVTIHYTLNLEYQQQFKRARSCGMSPLIILYSNPGACLSIIMFLIIIVLVILAQYRMPR